MKSSFKINGNQCLMCSNELLKEIGKIQGVFGANVNFSNNTVDIDHTDEVSHEELTKQLEKLEILNTKTN